MAVTFGRLYVIPALPAFLGQHPALDIDIVMDDASSDLIGEGIDVALRMGSLRDSTLTARRSEEHTSELQSLMRISYAVFCLKTKNTQLKNQNRTARQVTS